jgi:hypothetical protein
MTLLAAQRVGSNQRDESRLFVSLKPAQTARGNFSASAPWWRRSWRILLTVVSGGDRTKPSFEGFSTDRQPSRWWHALPGASCHPLGRHGHRSQCRRRGDSDFDVGLKRELWLKGLIATAVVALVIHWMADPVPGLGIAVPVFMPALVTAVIALLLSRKDAPPLAYMPAALAR